MNKLKQLWPKVRDSNHTHTTLWFCLAVLVVWVLVTYEPVALALAIFTLFAMCYAILYAAVSNLRKKDDD